MLCRSPFIRDRTGKVLRWALHHGLGKEDKLDGVPFPCGQCLACRINRRRVWTLRLMLENEYHAQSCFVTLTYSDESLPYTLDGQPCLCKRDSQLFLKRLRKRFPDRKIRFYLVGEYGTRTHRPHYHALLFGVGPDDLDSSWLFFNGRSGEKRNSLLSDTWHFGLVHVGMVSRESIQYVAGYVTKKFTKKNDGYVPEFALMSRKPGIGAQAVADISTALCKYSLTANFKGELRIDNKAWPLGRFLLSKLHDIGIEFNSFDDYLRTLSEAKANSAKAGIDFLDYLIAESSQANRKLDARDKLFNQRNTL